VRQPGSGSGRRWAVRLLVLGVLVGGGVALRQTVLAPKPVEVRVERVSRGRVESTVTNSRAGTVRARRRARLAPETGGRVTALPHREGQRVQADDLLLSLADESQQAQLLVAQRALKAALAIRDEAHARAERAEQELNRGRQLARSGVVTTDDVDRLQSAVRVAEAAVQTALARVDQAKAEVALAEAELAKCRLTAPFPGILAEVSVELGEWITPSPPLTPVPPVIDLIDPTSIYLSAPMDEVDSAVIKAGLMVRATIDPYPNQAFQGRVERVASYVLDTESQNRTVEVEVLLADAGVTSSLLPGTSADVEIILDAHDGVLRIPAAALLRGQKVLVLEGGVLVERPVEVGLKNWEFVEVTAGLSEGQQVVTSLGSEEVKAGVPAVVREDAR
jgi:HlyD family secretion protein